MTEWVLILWLFVGTGSSVTAQSFTTKERCEAAGQAVRDARKANEKFVFDRSTAYVCVER